jgi:hypothetical protein
MIIPDITTDMAEQIELATTAGHTMQSYMGEVDSVGRSCWVARCSQCGLDVTIWPSGVLYSILGDSCSPAG